VDLDGASQLPGDDADVQGLKHVVLGEVTPTRIQQPQVLQDRGLIVQGPGVDVLLVEGCGGVDAFAETDDGFDMGLQDFCELATGLGRVAGLPASHSTSRHGA